MTLLSANWNNCLIPLPLWNFSLYISYLKTQLCSVEQCANIHLCRNHFPSVWVTCKWLNQGHRTWENHSSGTFSDTYTSLHQNTFRCSDWVEQDIEVIWSTWLAEPGDKGQSGEEISYSFWRQHLKWDCCLKTRHLLQETQMQLSSRCHMTGCHHFCKLSLNL